MKKIKYLVFDKWCKNYCGYNFIGIMPISQKITIVPVNDPQHLRIGQVLFNEIDLQQLRIVK